MKDKLAKSFLTQCDYRNSWFGLAILNSIFGNPENHVKKISVSLEINSIMLKYDNGWRFSDRFQDTRVSLNEIFEYESAELELRKFEGLISKPSLFLEECIRIDKNIAIEKGGLSETEADKNASAGCKTQLSEIAACMKNNDLELCYEEYYVVEGQ